MKKLTEQTLREVFVYDPVTGIFTRHPGPGGRAGNKVGSLDSDGYLCIGVDGGRYRASRLAWLWMTGDWPPSGFTVDHINRNRSDDRWNNLRLATWSGQQFNKGKFKTNKSGITGVFMNKKNKYVATVGKKYLGQFKSTELAIAARERYIKEMQSSKSRRERDWLLVASPGWPEHVIQICDGIGQPSQ